MSGFVTERDEMSITEVAENSAVFAKATRRAKICDNSTDPRLMRMDTTDEAI